MTGIHHMRRQGVLLNALMLSALVATLSGPIHRFVPGWTPIYLVVACFVVALLSGSVHQLFRRDRRWLSELPRYLLPELLLLFVMMRVVATLGLGARSLGEDLSRWFYDPLAIFDVWMLGCLAAGLLVGWTAHEAAQDLVELSPGEGDFGLARSEDSQRVMQILSEDRAAALGRISQRFIIGGVALLLALALEAVNIQRIADASLPIAELSAIGALCYLVSGFLLYSQARLALLQARWQLDGASVSESVARRWTGTSRLLIAGIALAAVLLPRSYGLGLLDTLRALLGMVGYVIAFGGYLLISVFSLLTLIPAWLLSLMNPGDFTSTEPLVAPPVSTPPPPEIVRSPHFLSALVFWCCMVLLVGYALRIVLQRYPVPLRGLVQRSPLGWLLEWLRGRWGVVHSWSHHVVEFVRARAVRTPTAPVPRAWLGLNRLSPREQVRYFYRSTLRRAARRGLPRRSGQTPHEYREALGQRLPEAQEDLDVLTDAFVEAHYSPQPVDSEQVARVRRPWERLRRMLRPTQHPPGEG
ncbi:MAG TPA: DUF4129 domain-containing protein [Roseiflexaceae bacterium]|nr:DUF4129 domain-containing protein [Roseiflexaceae bacterium]